LRFKQHKDASCDMVFSWRERFILFFTGRLHFSAVTLRHLGNSLVKMVMDWNTNFDEDVKKMVTRDDTKIEAE
tara:strand:- start:82 stop:300 length:219 start_codon:yes stop_codon:yes gene_type:complete